MIESWRHKGLKQLFEDGNRKGINPRHVEKIETILGLLNVGQQIEDVDVHSFRLHPLTGNLKGPLVDNGARQLAHHFPI